MFTFVGNRYIFRWGEREFSSICSSYHRRLQALVALELNREFEARYIGKFSSTFRSSTIRSSASGAPSIGIILCKSSR